MTSALRKIARTALQGGAHNDVQILTLANNSGTDTFTLTYLDGDPAEETTAALNDDATAGDIQTALEDLTGIDVGDVTVTGTNPDFEIEFMGALGFQAIPLLVGTGTAMDADVTAGTTGYDNRSVAGDDGVEAEVTGSQFIVFSVLEASDEINGTFEFEFSKDGDNWESLDVTAMSDGSSASSWAAGALADSFYCQGLSGPMFVRATHTGDPFETDIPVVSIVAFG
jgi:hypothetical protein